MGCGVGDDLGAAKVAPDRDVNAGADGVLEPDGVLDPEAAVSSAGCVAPELDVESGGLLALLDGRAGKGLDAGRGGGEQEGDEAGGELHFGYVVVKNGYSVLKLGGVYLIVLSESDGVINPKTKNEAGGQPSLYFATGQHQLRTPSCSHHATTYTASDTRTNSSFRLSGGRIPAGNYDKAAILLR